MSGLIGETIHMPDESYLVADTLLGKGGFASVYLAWSSKGESAAVKVVDCKQQSSWANGKLRSEVTTLRRAQTHENIISLLGEQRIGSFHVFVLEEWGQDLLDQVLEHKGLGEVRALNVMAQVLRALEWLHSRSICHGYVHPAPLTPHAPRSPPRAAAPVQLRLLSPTCARGGGKSPHHSVPSSVLPIPQ